MDDFKQRLEAARAAQAQPLPIARIDLNPDGSYGLCVLPGAAISHKELAWALTSLGANIIKLMPEPLAPRDQSGG